MTCIVGLVDGGDVWIGGDSAASRESGELTLRRDPKVFRRGEYLIGFTDSWRMGQLLRYRLAVPERPGSVELFEWMATEFVDAVRRCLSEGGFAHIDNNVEEGGGFLVAVGGRLFGVDSDYQVGEDLSGYSAVGCGAEVALGALAATRDLGGRIRVKRALEAAELHMNGVRRPFKVVRY